MNKASEWSSYLIIGIVALCSCSTGTTESTDTMTLDSYRKGRSVVERAIEALGGASAIEEAGGLSLEAKGTFDLGTRYQGKKPGESEPVPLTEWLVFDPNVNRVGYEIKSKVNSDAEEWIRFVFQNEDEMLFVHLQGRFTFLNRSEDIVDNRRRHERIVPHLLLQAALKRPANLRYLGREKVSGKELHIVSFPVESGDVISMFFAVDSGLLTGFEYLVELPYFGDTLMRWTYGNYRDVNGLGPYPEGYKISAASQLLKEVTYTTIKAGPAGDSRLFKIPEGIDPPKPPPEKSSTTEKPSTPKWPQVKEVAPGVYVVQNLRSGFHMLFVEFEDFLLAVDAPTGWLELHMVPAKNFADGETTNSLSEKFIELMKETVPGKPVKYVALTHHHSDHAGGIRPFVAEGATILTTEVARQALEQAVNRSYTLYPDRLGQQPETPKFVLVKDRHIIKDDANEVHLIEVGPNPHADGMLVVYLPKHNILYESDLFEPISMRLFPLPARVPTMRWFIDWLDTQGLKPSQHLAVHGSGIVTDEQVEKIMSMKDTDGQN